MALYTVRTEMILVVRADSEEQALAEIDRTPAVYELWGEDVCYDFTVTDLQEMEV